jgi:hypothetical protein
MPNFEFGGRAQCTIVEEGKNGTRLPAKDARMSTDTSIGKGVPLGLNEIENVFPPLSLNLLCSEIYQRCRDDAFE